LKGIVAVAGVTPGTAFGCSSLSLGCLVIVTGGATYFLDLGANVSHAHKAKKNERPKIASQENSHRDCTKRLETLFPL
jgi:hypothetical protein